MLKKLLLVISVLLLIAPAVAVSQPADVLMVVQGSNVSDDMRLNILHTAIKTISNGLDKESRLGLFEFDSTATQQSPLTPVNILNEHSLLASLLKSSKRNDRQINTATALELAIYQLRTEGRHDALRLIIMLGDGITSMGDSSVDTELNRWMKTELSAEAIRAGINIYWMTFTESANYQVIQNVTQKTQGRYYRTYDSNNVRLNVEDILSSIGQPVLQVIQENSGKSTDNMQGGGEGSAGESSTTAFVKIPVLLSVGGSSVLFIAILLYLRRKKNSYKKVVAHTRRAGDRRVILRDMSEFTAMAEYDITGHRTYIGRIPREVTERSCVIVISDNTVGRNHATIECNDKGYWLTDHGTVNGTYINGSRLQGTSRLSSGDRIRFARFEFKINIPVAAVPDGNIQESYPVKQACVSDTITDHDDDRTVFRSKQ